MSLAEDLVTAARSVLCPDEDRPFYTERQLVGIERDACAAVVAVLKQLAAKPDGYLRMQEDGGITYTRTLRELVEDIESAALGVPQAEKPQP